MIIKCKNEKETNEIGIKIAEILKPSDFICLDGDLGTGKTHIAKSIIKALGVEEYVTSPSYTIVNEYESDCIIYHFDVYRIDDIDEMYEIGYEEYFFSDGICLVEWANMIEELLPKEHYKIKLQMGDTFDERILEITGTTDELESRLGGIIL